MEKIWTIVQYDDRDILKHEKLMDRNKKYCEKHSYEYIFKSNGYNEYPPYWVKVALIVDLLSEIKTSGIMWLDTDAVIYNFDKSINELLGSNKSFAIAPEDPKWYCPNTGVWIIKNNEVGKNIMKLWLSTYNKNSWVKKNNKWTCNGTWAGKDYEQGALCEYVIPKFKDDIQLLPWYILQNTDISNKNVFSLHFSAKNPKLKNFIDMIDKIDKSKC